MHDSGRIRCRLEASPVNTRFDLGGREVNPVCSDQVYANASAVIETYRTPGRAPQRGDLSVERCDIVFPP